MTIKANPMQTLVERVETEDNLTVATLGELREALGYGRLGVGVLVQISKALYGVGLGYYPTWVLDDNPVPRQGDAVRVFRKGTPVGDVIEAVLHPTIAGDQRLRSGTGGQAAEVLDRIRAMVN